MYARPTTCTLSEIVIALQTFYYMLRKQKFTRLNTVIMATVMATSGYPADKDSVHIKAYKLYTGTLYTS